jgi:hypothetical protein
MTILRMGPDPAVVFFTDPDGARTEITNFRKER